VSWCSVINTPASTSTNTDNALTQRLVTLSSRIFTNPAGINFVPARLVPGTNFPKIPDLDSAGGAGNLLDRVHIIQHPLNQYPNRYPDYDSYRELEDFIHRCKLAWEAQGGWQGIVAVNVGRYLMASEQLVCGRGAHDWVNCYQSGVRSSHTPTATVGLSGCEYQLRSVVTWTCHDGVVSVSDSALISDATNQQVLGHELGHALSLEHVCADTVSCAPTMLMNPLAVGGSSGDVGNIAISTNDIGSARRAASYVSNVVVDPPQKIALGDIAETSKLDNTNENTSLPGYADLSEMKVIYNRSDNTVSFGEEIEGLLPENITEKVHYWTLVNTDNKSTGGTGDSLTAIGVPPTHLKGVDLVMEVEPIEVQPTMINFDKDPVYWQNVTLNTSAWIFRNGKFVELPSQGFFRTLVMSPSVLPPHLFVQPNSLSTSGAQSPPPSPMALRQSFFVIVPVQHLDLSPSRSVLVQGLVTIPSIQNSALDSIVNSTEEETGGARLVLGNATSELDCTVLPTPPECK
jgi:hypothetical protein